MVAASAMIGLLGDIGANTAGIASSTGVLSSKKGFKEFMRRLCGIQTFTIRIARV